MKNYLGWSSLIPDPDLDFLPIPDPGVKKGTGSRIGNTGTGMYEVHPRSNWKKEMKRERLQGGVIIFFWIPGYLKAYIADLITLLSSSLRNSEGSGDSGDSCADPCQEFKQGFLGGF